MSQRAKPTVRQKFKDLDTVIKMITVAAVLLVLILVATLVGNLIKLGAEKKHNAALNAQLDAINAELAVVEGDIDYKSTDEWIERYAREHLGMLRPGEKPFAPKK